MTSEPTAEQRISEWLHDEATGQLPDWVLTATFERTRAARQQRDLRRWRFPPMNIPMKIVLWMAIGMAALIDISLSAGQRTDLSKTCATPVRLRASERTVLTERRGVAYGGRSVGPVPLVDVRPYMRRHQFPQHRRGPGRHRPIGPNWVADAGHDRFAIFEPDGSFVEYWGSTGSHHGQFLMEDSNSDARGEVTFAPDGTFYVLDPGNLRIQHFDRARNFLHSWGGRGRDPGHYVVPVALAVDTNGVVNVLDTGRSVVEKYNEDGAVLGSFDPHILDVGADDIAVDRYGNTYISVGVNDPNRVEEFDPAGRLI